MKVVLDEKQFNLLKEGYKYFDGNNNFYAFSKTIYKHIKGLTFEIVENQKFKQDIFENYTKADMEKSFIAGGKSCRDINNDGFDEFLEKLNKKI